MIPANSLVGKLEIIEFIKAADDASGYIAVVNDGLSGKMIQILPDLVVKSQTTDIIGLIL